MGIWGNYASGKDERFSRTYICIATVLLGTGVVLILLDTLIYLLQLRCRFYSLRYLNTVFFNIAVSFLHFTANLFFESSYVVFFV